jgi:RNA polymerase sigma-70 factor (ECF subfamily)
MGAPAPRTVSAKSDPDGLFVFRLKQGEALAFEELVDRYEQPILSAVTRILPDPIEAEDVAQKVFLHVFKSVGGFCSAATLWTWLYAIARNLSLNELRRRSRRAVEPLDCERGQRCEEAQPCHAHARHPTGAEALLHEELRRKIEEAVAALPERQRLAIQLVREEGSSYEEIAAVLRTSLSATKALIHHARRTLKRRLKPYLRTGAWAGESRQPSRPMKPTSPVHAPSYALETSATRVPRPW